MQKTRNIVPSEEDVARFWSKVNKEGPNGCWIWTGFRNPKGYGHTYIGSIVFLAHRVSYVLATGDQAEGLQVLHECPAGLDNPACVNPAHLRAGTHAENMDRRDSLGHVASGEQSGTSKLTDERVREILHILDTTDRSTRSIAAEYGVSHVAIGDISLGRSWKHLPRKPTNRPRRKCARSRIPEPDEHREVA